MPRLYGFFQGYATDPRGKYDKENGYMHDAGQLSLAVAILKSFDYDMTVVEVMIRHGTHTHYAIPKSEEDEFELSELIYPFI